MRRISEEEKQKIEMMIGYGMKISLIADVTGWSQTTISRIKNGTLEQHRQECNERNQMNRVKNGQKEDANSNSTMTAGSLEYTNLLLNSILMKMNALLEELGVGDKAV